MKILELFTGEQPLFIEENNKKYKNKKRQPLGNRFFYQFILKYKITSHYKATTTSGSLHCLHT